MCNPLENIDVYRYDKKDIKRARKEHIKKRESKMVKMENPENSLSQWISENMPESGIQEISVLTAAEYESILENGLQRDNVLYLVEN